MNPHLRTQCEPASMNPHIVSQSESRLKIQVVNILMTAVTDKPLQHHLCHIVQLAASRETAAVVSTPRAKHLLALVGAIETAWAAGQQALQSRSSKT